MKNPPVYSEVITTAEELMVSTFMEVDSSDLGLRILNVITGSSIIGIITDESPDSFLVILPSKLILVGEGPGAQKFIEPHLPVKYVRYMKSTVLNVIPCFGEYEYYYIQHLISKGPEIYPEYFNIDYLSVLCKRFEDIGGKTPEEIPQVQSTKTITEEENENVDLTDKLVVKNSSRYKH